MSDLEHESQILMVDRYQTLVARRCWKIFEGEN